jgi:hypothetical protein
MAKYRGTDTTWERATAADFLTLATIPNLREVTPGLGGALAQFDQSSYGDVWMDFGAGQKEGDEVTLNHVPSDFRWKITGTGLGTRIVPDRTGSLAIEIRFKIVNPGVVQESIP